MFRLHVPYSSLDVYDSLRWSEREFSNRIFHRSWRFEDDIFISLRSIKFVVDEFVMECKAYTRRVKIDNLNNREHFNKYINQHLNLAGIFYNKQFVNIEVIKNWLLKHIDYINKLVIYIGHRGYEAAKERNNKNKMQT